MTGIDQLRSISSIGAVGGQTPARAQDAARFAATEIGHRVLLWTATIAPGHDGTGAWSARMGAAPGDFAPDRVTLANRGDVYGLRELAADISGQLGATAVNEGTLLHALEDFAREAAIQLNGLAGLPGDLQASGVAEVIDRMLDGDTPDTIAGVTQLLSDATRCLQTQRL